MSEYVEIVREANSFCRLPDNLDTPVWRYMGLYKFQSLLSEKALYLCRADLLQDRFEGTYSRHQITEMEDWLKEIKAPHIIESEKESRQKDRLRTYISCWCMGDYDFDLMWKSYIRKHPGIAIKSSVRRLKNICDKSDLEGPLNLSMVSYFDRAGGQYINYFGTPTTFLYKDAHFKLDNELRIIYSPNIIGTTPTHEYLKVDLEDLIEEVVIQPKAREDSLSAIREALIDVGLHNIPVLASREDRED